MIVPRNLLRGFILILLTATVGGCGYHLRGTDSTSSDLVGVFIDGPTAIKDALVQRLEDGGSQTQSTRESAQFRVLLSNETLNRRLLSVDSTTIQEREFELIYQVAFRVLDGRGEILIPRQTLSLLRDYVFDDTSAEFGASAVLGASEEEEVLRAEMRRDAAGQILRRINAVLEP